MKPARIRVLGKPFTIEFVPIEHIGLRDNAEDPDPGMGRTSPERQEIFIRTGQPLESEQDTVLHECIHAVDETLGLQLNEFQVTILSTGLLAVLKENDELVEYLSKKACADCGGPERTPNRSYCSACNVRRVRAWQKANPEAKRKYHRKKAYGLSEEQYQQMVKEQEGFCANQECGRPASHIDHDHSTGVVRGLLCGQCNTSLGLLRDSPERAEGLATYLRRRK